MEVTGKIKSVIYRPLMCNDLHTYLIESMVQAFESRDASFLLDFGVKGKIAVSRWVSPKRTRSYPYARVYNTYGFTGKKVTIIPVMKDEGGEGDRDFLQWDTICLMSLLGVNVIIAYYDNAIASTRYQGKISHQQFNMEYIRQQLSNLMDCQSDALHWNIEQTDPNRLESVCQKSLQFYDRIGASLGISMHNRKSAVRKLEEIYMSRETFLARSRFLARSAQQREIVTLQPKESVEGQKASITVINYLGGEYSLTLDECEITGSDVRLIEAKHTKHGAMPSEDDIKDGIIKMVLFTNLHCVFIGHREYAVIPVLKLSTALGFNVINLSASQRQLYNKLIEEAHSNNFQLRFI